MLLKFDEEIVSYWTGAARQAVSPASVGPIQFGSLGWDTLILQPVAGLEEPPHDGEADHQKN